jgi:uncharacterized protein (DUF1501 family)
VFEAQAATAGVLKEGRILVVLQLSGGCDGLNVVVPTRNDVYYASRPTLGLQRESTLRLTDENGLHPALTGLKELYDEGMLGIFGQVGYPNPDRSHFRSMDIWQSASNTEDFWTSGWLGRYLDNECKGYDDLIKGIEMDDTLSLAMQGEKFGGIGLSSPGRFFQNANSPLLHDLAEATNVHTQTDDARDYMYKTLVGVQSSIDHIQKDFRINASQVSYPKSALSARLQTVARLINSGMPTRVYYASHATYDTHVLQLEKQGNQLADLNGAVSAFWKDLKASNRQKDVLMLVFSEFGRRVKENLGKGTDHGTANNVFVISGGLAKQGLLTPQPDLKNLVDGDLVMQTDYRRIYATVLNKWLEADDQEIMKKKWDLLSFV